MGEGCLVVASAHFFVSVYPCRRRSPEARSWHIYLQVPALDRTHIQKGLTNGPEGTGKYSQCYAGCTCLVPL